MLKRTSLGPVLGNGRLIVQPRKGRTRDLVYLHLIGARGGSRGSIIVDKARLLEAIQTTDEAADA